MIIIVKNPESSYFRDNDDRSNVDATVYHGTNDPMVAFRLHMKAVYPHENIDDLADEQLLDLTLQPYVNMRFSEMWKFSVFPTKEGVITVEEVEAEIFLEASLDDLFENNGD
jgi:hypothetical protein